MPTSAELIAKQMARELPILETCDAPPAEPLFHYTTAAGLKGILAEKRIRATHFMHLNDREEIAAGEGLVADVFKQLSTSEVLGAYERGICEDFLAQFAKRPPSKVVDVFVASFTEEGNDLSQWRAYGALGGGYSIGFTRLPFPLKEPASPDTAVVGVSLEKVEYEEAAMQQRIRELVVPMVKGMAKYWGTYGRSGEPEMRAIWREAMTLLFQQVGAVVTRYKNRAFRQEVEWRIVAITGKRLPPGSLGFDLRPAGVVPYIEISLAPEATPLEVARIFVGPTQDPDRGVHAARMLVKDLGFDPNIVVPSGIPLRA